MAVREFTVVLDRAPTGDEFDALFEAGLDDTTPEIDDGRGYLHVAREASSLAGALSSVVADARRAGFDVVGVQTEDLVPLKTVAARLGRSYESLRLLTSA